MFPPFVSVADLASFTHRDIGVDPAAVFAVESACETVRTYIGQTINLVRDDTVEFRGQQILLLPELPVVSVNHVTLNGDTVDESDRFVAVGGILYVKDSGRYRNVWDYHVTVDYDHGWAVDEEEESGVTPADPVPSDLKLVALRLAVGTLDEPGVRMRAESLGAYAYTRMDDLSREEKWILDRYKP